MKVCPNCKSQVESDHLFCMECGYKFEMEEAPAAAHEAPSAPAPDADFSPLPQMTEVPEMSEKPVASPADPEITDVQNHIMWNIQPGQVAKLISEKEYLQYSDVDGIIVNEGARVLLRHNADEYTMLSSGIYSFRQKPSQDDPEPRKGFLRNMFSSSTAAQPDEDKLNLYSILLVRDGSFPVIFGGGGSTGENFIPMTIPAKNLDVEVGVSAMIRISGMMIFAGKYMLDRTSLTVSDLVAQIAPSVEKVLRDVLADVYVSENGIPEAVKTEISDRLKAISGALLGGITIESVEDIRAGHEALERFRALNSELYLTGRELDYLERTNEFKNRLAALQNAQQVEEARNDLALMRALQQINQDKILAEDELEKFYMVLSREKKIREAQSEEQIAAALADIERTGLLRSEDMNRLKDEIRMNEHKRGHALRLMQKKDEIELVTLQREFELRVRDEDYEFEKRKKDDEFDRFKELERMRSEKEAAEHERNMESLREMQRAKLERIRLSQNLTPEQLLALSAENLDKDAVISLAQSLGKNREAEYLERLTQERIQDMKEMMQAGNETTREFIRAASPNAGAAQQPQQQPTRFCPTCGSRNSAEAKFCMSCGAPMK